MFFEFSDTDECLSDVCGEGSKSCVNKPLAYDCICDEGYSYNDTGYGHKCEGKLH